MTTPAALDAISEIIRDVLDEPDLEVDMSSNADTIEGWDSMTQVRIVLALESEYDLQFSAEKISELTSVALLVSEIESAVATL